MEFLSSRSPDDSKPHLAAFLRGLEAFGYSEGKNIQIVYRWAMGQYDELPRLALELIELNPLAIAAPGGSPSARAAKAATNSIPIFFVMADAVREGVVDSLSQPGGNITGVDIMSGELTGKRLELLCQLVPVDKPLAFLVNSKNPLSSTMVKDMERAAQLLGRKVLVQNAIIDADLERAFSFFSEQSIAGVVVENDAYFDSRRDQIIELTKRRPIRAIYHIRDFPASGGLMSYGANLADAYYQIGVQISRVLKGARVTDLPVIRPTKFELTLNLKTANALGFTVPASLWAIADEVID